MTLVVWKNYLEGQILYRSLVPPIKNDVYTYSILNSGYHIAPSIVRRIRAMDDQSLSRYLIYGEVEAGPHLCSNQKIFLCKDQ